MRDIKYLYISRSWKGYFSYSDYRLVIICSNEDEDKSYMVSKLQLYRRPLTTVYSDQECALYLKNHFTTLSRAQSEAPGQRIWASEVDLDKLVPFGYVFKCFMKLFVKRI